MNVYSNHDKHEESARFSMHITVLEFIIIEDAIFHTFTGRSIFVNDLPPIGNIFASLPESVLGGCTIMMFGTILTSGIEMISKAGFNQRNVTQSLLYL